MSDLRLLLTQQEKMLQVPCSHLRLKHSQLMAMTCFFDESLILFGTVGAKLQGVVFNAFICMKYDFIISFRIASNLYT